MKYIYKHIVDIKNLTYSSKDTCILKDINISLDEHNFYSIIGPNGSGKTTLLKNILKIIHPKEKTIYLKGKDITTFSSKNMAKEISSVPQNTSVNFDFTALDIVLMGRAPYLKRFENEGENDLKIAEEAMKMTSTWKLKDKNINNLSGGERQRVIIARALAQKSKIMLLDEPISNLDIQHQIDILDTVKFSNKNLTVVAVLHDLNLASEYSDYLILVKDGKIICTGTPYEVLTENIIKDVYGAKVCIIKNPITKKPHIIPISKYSSKKIFDSTNTL